MAKHRRKFNSALPIWLTLLGFVGLSVVVGVLLSGKDIILLNPKGPIAEDQMRLLVISTLLMLEIAIPSLFLFYYFAWRYRETNEKASHETETNYGKFFSFSIWAFPTITAILLAIVLIPAAHKLEPQKPINGADDPLTIQVVALRWKWLFIYPEQNIATVNFVQLPVNTPVEFEITADETPMSSFWIPHLGGQLYAMTEHVNRLNLMGYEVGDYEGSVAEINGAGFSGMRFNTRVSSLADFNSWVVTTRSSTQSLDFIEYERLLEPSKNNQVAFYTSPAPKLYSTILGKYVGAHDQGSGITEHGGH